MNSENKLGSPEQVLNTFALNVYDLWGNLVMANAAIRELCERSDLGVRTDLSDLIEKVSLGGEYVEMISKINSCLEPILSSLIKESNDLDDVEE